MAGSDPNKQQVFFIHGGNAFSEYEQFLAYLQNKELRDLPWSEDFTVWSRHLPETLGESYEVFTPTMPNKQNAKYEEWKIWFERHFEYLNDNLTLVGWSLGGCFLIKYLVENKTPFTIKNLLLLASPFTKDDLNGEDGGDFTFATEAVGVLKERASNIFIFHSKDDFVVPYSHSEKLATALPEAEFITFEDKNHFLIEEFPELITKIKKLA